MASCLINMKVLDKNHNHENKTDDAPRLHGSYRYINTDISSLGALTTRNRAGDTYSHQKKIIHMKKIPTQNLTTKTRPSTGQWYLPIIY